MIERRARKKRVKKQRKKPRGFFYYTGTTGTGTGARAGLHSAPRTPTYDHRLGHEGAHVLVDAFILQNRASHEHPVSCRAECLLFP